MADTLKLVKKISRLAEGKPPLRFMEVCGTHTVAIFRSGIRQILPENISLVSGPGCPVCVTDDDYIDRAIAYARQKNFIVATFGDMLKVPGSRSSLAAVAADGADVRVVYSPLEAIAIAQDNPRKKIIFLAVGFETTSPTQAATVIAAQSRGVKNLFMLSAQKLVPPAIKQLVMRNAQCAIENSSPLRITHYALRIDIDGFLLPGHVAVVIGAKAFKFLADDFKIPGAIGGFEADEILSAIASLLEQIDGGRAEVTNNYPSVVTETGNVAAQKILSQVYAVADADWRGIGKIPASGLKMRDEFADFDIERVEPIEIPRAEKKSACRCGDVLRGVIDPPSCPLFGKACKPLHAVGPCMVSVEGVCAAWFKYGGAKFNFRT